MTEREQYEAKVEANDDDPAYWGTCDHGVSLAPWVDCAACEVREDDADA